MAAFMVLFFGIAFFIGHHAPDTIQAAPQESEDRPQGLSDLQTRVLLLRELALSSDQVMKASGAVGLCGLNIEQLGQVMRGLQADLDAEGSSSVDQSRALADFPSCPEDCKQALCASKIFKQLNERRDQYGSGSDGI